MVKRRRRPRPRRPPSHPRKPAPRRACTRRLGDGTVVRRRLTRDPDGPDRWAYRARCGSGIVKKKPGHAWRSEAARDETRRWTLQCRRKDCGALIDWRRAKDNARRRGRLTMAKGDGCAGRRCAARHDKAKFARTQRQMAAQLRAGTRVLAAWPADVWDTDVWILPMEMCDAAIAVAAARV